MTPDSQPSGQLPADGQWCSRGTMQRMAEVLPGTVAQQDQEIAQAKHEGRLMAAAELTAAWWCHPPDAG